MSPDELASFLHILRAEGAVRFRWPDGHEVDLAPPSIPLVEQTPAYPFTAIATSAAWNPATEEDLLFAHERPPSPVSRPVAPGPDVPRGPA